MIKCLINNTKQENKNFWELLFSKEGSINLLKTIKELDNKDKLYNYLINMETKEIKIKVPEGFVIDTDNSDLTTGVIKFKKADTKPRSWEEFCKNNNITGGESFIRHDSIIEKEESDVNAIRSPYKDKNYCTSKEEAEAFLALMQLRQLRKAWVGEWKPTPNILHSYIYYDIEDKKLQITNCRWREGVMSFPNYDIALLFREDFEDLLEKAKILL